MPAGCQLTRASPLQWALAGRLTLYTVTDVMVQAQHWLREIPTGEARELSLDMQGITQSDTAGVVLIIGLQREAMRRQMTLACRNVPEHLRDIADLSGLCLPSMDS